MSGCVPPWQPNMACSPEWDTLDPDLQHRSTMLAWSTTRLLTGGRVGSCETVMRPCVEHPCEACTFSWNYLYPYLRNPYIYRGQVYNTPVCGTGSCWCEKISQVKFPGHVADIVSVLIDGERLAPFRYRLVDHQILLRTDGEEWPSCQDINQPETGKATFAIHYYPGIKPDDAGLWAVGVLAYEYSKACTGAKCRLPASVTSISRQGVSMDFDNGMFSNGLTGIREVDTWIMSINPHGMRTPARVWSPDAPAHVYETL